MFGCADQIFIVWQVTEYSDFFTISQSILSYVCPFPHANFTPVIDVHSLVPWFVMATLAMVTMIDGDYVEDVDNDKENLSILIFILYHVSSSNFIPIETNCQRGFQLLLLYSSKMMNLIM